MGTFSGFPSRSEATPVPAAFFSEVLPLVEDLAELKVFLVALRLIRQRKGAVRWVAASEVMAAPEIGALGVPPEQRAAAIERALAASVARGALLALPLGDGTASETAHFLNDAEGRRALELARSGAVSLGLPPAPLSPTPPEEASIFRLYEDAIGPIPGAGLADELKEAEREYPLEWLRQAFQEAAAHNVRRWAYVRAILARWREEGREDGAAGRGPAQARYRAGRYGRVVRS